MAEGVKPPVAKRVPHTVRFGRVEGEDRGPEPMDPPKERVDDLFWLRDDDRKDTEILAHLKAENDYTEACTAHLKPFEGKLYAELKSHLKETDKSAPYPWGPFEYFTSTVEGLSYKSHCRRQRGADAGADVVLLDENKLAAGHTYMTVGEVSPSPSHTLLGYTVDTVGYETYQLKVRDLSAGAEADGSADTVVAPAVDSSVVWGGDESTLFYTTLDETHRPWKLWRHARGGAAGGEDECLFTEEDERFNLGVEKSRSGRFIIVSTSSSETSEVWVLDLEQPESGLRCVAAREHGVLYEVDHRGEELFIVTNADGALNFKLMAAPVSAVLSADGGRAAWAPVGGFAYDPQRKVDGVLCFADFLAVFGREKGLTQAWILRPQGPSGEAWDARQWTAPEEAYEVTPGPNEEFHSSHLRLVYCSMVTPITSISHSVLDGADTIVKRTEVPGYDPSLYRTTRLEATAQDGTKVPISLVYRADARPPGGGPMPCLLDGYGSYGICCEPDFSYLRLPLLDRGLVYAVAHIRGGGEMGRHWYQLEGKYLQKKNTFSDFCDVAAHLVAQGWTAPNKLACMGRSAGGLLMGAVINMRPDLFRVCLAGVPFVDVLTTMCDPSIPLTTLEWEEWGNTNEEKYFDYIASYSPMDNITAQDYPATLVTAGLHDPRVAYWEPAKWVARLRTHNTGKLPLLLKTELDAGHFSASDRYRLLRERAFEYTFLLDQLGRAEKV